MKNGPKEWNNDDQGIVSHGWIDRIQFEEVMVSSVNSTEIKQVWNIEI